MTAPQSPALPPSGSSHNSGLPSHKHWPSQAPRLLSELACREQNNWRLSCNVGFIITCDDLTSPDGIWAEVTRAAHIQSTHLVITQSQWLAITQDRAYTDAQSQPTRSALLLCLHMFEAGRQNCAGLCEIHSANDGLQKEGSTRCSSAHSRPAVKALHRR